MGKLIYIFVLCLLVITFVFAQVPSVSMRIYWPGMWHDDENWGEFQLGYWHPDSFLVSWTVYSSDPSIGYPYHSGNVSGINDTVKVRVYFDNQTADDYGIGLGSPEEWFYPVLYDPYVDVFESSPLADTSDFEYRFDHWVTMINDVITTQPDTIHCRSSRRLGNGANYGIIYSIWGVNPGTFRVILKPTSSLPSNIRLVLASAYNYFTITNGQNLADTLNSYSIIATSALLRREYTLFNTYVSNIYNLNLQSLPGWALRYHGYAAQADTTNALSALDSLLYNLENRLDPQIPDSSSMTSIHISWLQQWTADYQHYRARMLYPDVWKYRLLR